MLGLLPLAALLAIFLCLSPGSKAGATPVDLTVMTRNLYVGADAEDVRRYQLWLASIGATVPTVNAGAKLSRNIIVSDGYA